MSPLPDPFLERLCHARRACPVPPRARAEAERFARELLSLLFPHFATERRCAPEQVREDAARALEAVRHFVGSQPESAPRADAVAAAFAERLPVIYDALLDDARAIHDADPAARSVDEVVVAYPGFLALACYRIAHALDGFGVPLLPRLVTEAAHAWTGIDIHPGARLGHALSIDHGTGIVIGETAVVGDRVRFYQGVTLGALSVEKRRSNEKRHPTIEHDVILYANATILGGDTVVGARSVIGGNVWLTRSVPPDSIVTEVPNIRRREAAGNGSPVP